MQRTEAITSEPTPDEPNNPAQVGDDANLVTLIANIENYLKALKENYPAIEQPTLAALIPISIWTVLVLGLIFTNAQFNHFKNKAEEAKLFSRYNEESNIAKIKNGYFIARTVIISIAGFLLAPTLLYLWKYYPLIRDGDKIHNEHYDHILTYLHDNVVDHLIKLEAIEKDRAAPDTLLPVTSQTIRALEAAEATLREDQPRLTLIQTFTDLKDILEILRSEIIKKQRPLTLMFAQPQDNRGSVISSVTQDEDLEANTHANAKPGGNYAT